MFPDETALDDSRGGVARVLLDCFIVAPPLLPFLVQREPVPRVLQSALSGLPVETRFLYQTKLVCFRRLSTTGTSVVEFVSYIQTAPLYLAET